MQHFPPLPFSQVPGQEEFLKDSLPKTFGSAAQHVDALIPLTAFAFSHPGIFEKSGPFPSPLPSLPA